MYCIVKYKKVKQEAVNCKQADICLISMETYKSHFYLDVKI